MIRFTFDDNDGRTHLGLGVSRENINRLTSGYPIRVDVKELNISVNGALMIYFGETEIELQQAIAEFIGPETKVNIDPRMKSKLT
jgi:hypothetical protein